MIKIKRFSVSPHPRLENSCRSLHMWETFFLSLSLSIRSTPKSSNLKKSDFGPRKNVRFPSFCVVTAGTRTGDYRCFLWYRSGHHNVSQLSDGMYGSGTRVLQGGLQMDTAQMWFLSWWCRGGHTVYIRQFGLRYTHERLFPHKDHRNRSRRQHYVHCEQRFTGSRSNGKKKKRISDKRAPGWIEKAEGEGRELQTVAQLLKKKKPLQSFTIL